MVLQRQQGQMPVWPRETGHPGATSGARPQQSTAITPPSGARRGTEPRSHIPHQQFATTCWCNTLIEFRFWRGKAPWWIWLFIYALHTKRVLLIWTAVIWTLVVYWLNVITCYVCHSECHVALRELCTVRHPDYWVRGLGGLILSEWCIVTENVASKNDNKYEKYPF